MFKINSGKIMKFNINITTFNRPKEIINLLRQLKSIRNSINFLNIYNDASQLDYSNVEDYLKTNFKNYKYFKAKENSGKFKHWKVINDCIENLEKKSLKCDYFLFLQDDNIICNNFIKDIKKYIIFMNKYNNFKFKSANGFALNLFRDKVSLRGNSRWRKIPYTDLNKYIFLCNYIDGMFLCDKKALSSINFKVDSIPPSRWLGSEDNKKLSSGVFQNITYKFLDNNVKIYMGKKSLVQQQDGSSVMHKHKKINIKSINFNE